MNHGTEYAKQTGPRLQCWRGLTTFTILFLINDKKNVNIFGFPPDNVQTANESLRTKIIFQEATYTWFHVDTGGPFY